MNDAMAYRRVDTHKMHRANEMAIQRYNGWIDPQFEEPSLKYFNPNVLRIL